MTPDELLHSVRHQITDVGKSFLQTIIATGGTNRYGLNYAPVQAESITVFVNSVDVSHEVAVEERTGVLVFQNSDHYPKKNDVIAAGGIHYRFFTDDELTRVCQDATAMHISGKSVTLATLQPMENLPVQILCAIQAIYVLLTDAAFDIDINAPDGVNIPRSERYRQLLELLQVLEARYRDLSSNLNVGMYTVDVFTLRRVSKRTNRLVPVYLNQEIDDASRPKRILVAPSLLGTQPIDTGIGVYDWDVISGDPVSAVLDFAFDITGCVIENAIRYSPVGNSTSPPVKTFTMTVVDAAAGQVRFSLTGEQTRSLPYNCLWEVQVRKPGETESRTKMHGMVRATNNEIVRGDPNALPIAQPVGAVLYGAMPFGEEIYGG